MTFHIVWHIMKTPNKKEGKQTFSYKYPSFSGPGFHSQGSRVHPLETDVFQLFFIEIVQRWRYWTVTRSSSYEDTGSLQNHIVVDVIETGFLADWMPARKMEGREARCLATAKKSMFPVWISLKREILWYILSRQSPWSSLSPIQLFQGLCLFWGRKQSGKVWGGRIYCIDVTVQ